MSPVRLWEVIKEKRKRRKEMCREMMRAQDERICEPIKRETLPPYLDRFPASVRGALQRMLERKMGVEQPMKAKINVQVRIKKCKGWLLS